MFILKNTLMQLKLNCAKKSRPTFLHSDEKTLPVITNLLPKVTKTSYYVSEAIKVSRRARFG